MLVLCVRLVRSAFHRKNVKGREHSLHSAPWSSFIICTYGLLGRQFSQTEGKSVVSQPDLLRSCLICGGGILPERLEVEGWWGSGGRVMCYMAEEGRFSLTGFLEADRRQTMHQWFSAPTVQGHKDCCLAGDCHQSEHRSSARMQMSRQKSWVPVPAAKASMRRRTLERAILTASHSLALLNSLCPFNNPYSLTLLATL